MRVLITGGAGFIGSHLADAYLKRGDQVVVVDDLSAGRLSNLESAIAAGAEFQQLSILDDSLPKLISDFNPEIINHHAAQKSVRDSVSKPVLDAEINLLGLIKIMEAARLLKNLPRVLFASSGGVVYGEQDEPFAKESHPTRPASPYGVSKLSSEYYLNYYSQVFGFRCVALRYSNVFGPRQDPYGEAGVVAIFSKKMISDEEVTIFGTGEQTRDFLYVSDIVDANLAVEKSLDSFACYNIGSQRATNVLSLFEKLSKIATYKKDPLFAEARSGEQLHSCLNTEKASQELSWSCKVSLEEGLEKTFRCFQSEGS